MEKKPAAHPNGGNPVEHKPIDEIISFQDARRYSEDNPAIKL
jgi:hypothetical protein